MGKGVSKAIANINNTIGPKLVEAKLDPSQQKEIDDFLLKLDGTDNKSKLGANALLGVSMACTKAGAVHKGLPLYRHIAEIAGNKSVILPVPVSVLSCDTVVLTTAVVLQRYQRWYPCWQLSGHARVHDRPHWCLQFH